MDEYLRLSLSWSFFLALGMVEKALKDTQEEYERIKGIPEEQRTFRQKDTVGVYIGMKQKKEGWQEQLEAEKAYEATKIKSTTNWKI